jgi:hypothetical protein
MRTPAFGPQDLDVAGVDRLLDGLMSHGDAPDGYRDVVRLVDVIRTGVAAEEPVWEPQTVRQMVDRIRDAQPRPRRPQLRLAAAAVVTTVAALASTGTAAATVGLPDSWQAVAHGIVAHLGLSSPKANLPPSASPVPSGAVQPSAPRAVAQSSPQPTASTTSVLSTLTRQSKPRAEIPPATTAGVYVASPTPDAIAQPLGPKLPTGRARAPTLPSTPPGKARTPGQGKPTKTGRTQSPHCPVGSCRSTR